MMQPTRQSWNSDAVTAPHTTAVARLELAAACRLLAREGLAPSGGARLAARDPEATGTYLTNPAAPLLEELRPSRLIAVDRDGVCHDTEKPEPDSGALAIVLAALEAKPDAAAAALIASASGCVVASLEDGLLPITQTAFMFHGAIGNFDFDPTADASTLRRDVGAALGDGYALLVVGRPARLRQYFGPTWKPCSFSTNAAAHKSRQWRPHAAGTPLTVPSDAVVTHAVLSRGLSNTRAMSPVAGSSINSTRKIFWRS